ncbi:MAG: prepilin-type N-terminal cleavage/methylation domain-containing protein [Desulfosalsimonadaceae bacterium]
MKITVMRLFPGQKAGYTIVEVLIAMAIFAIGFLAVAGLQIRAVKSATASRAVTQALELADARAEHYRALSFYPDFTDTSLSSTERFETQPQLAPGEYEMTIGMFTIRSRIIDNAPLPPVKNIYTHTPHPAMVVVAKTICISVHETANPGAILAEMEMVKIWEKDL